MPRKNNVNVSKVTKNGHEYYCARWTAPFDKELGYKPAPKYFYAKTEREAVAKRNTYVPPRKELDNKTKFATFLKDTFLPNQEAKSINGQITWEWFSERKRRLNQYLLEPEDEKLKKCDLRQVRVGSLQPAHVEQFFRALIAAQINTTYIARLKDDLKLALELAKKKIPERPGDYFLDADVPTIPRRKKERELFKPSQVFEAIIDNRKPIEHRAIVAFALIMQCRPSEMYALEWSDIDLEAGSVSFHKATRMMPGGGFGVTEGTKTGEKGRRTVAMGAALTQILRELKKARMGDSRPSYVRSNKYVFTTKRGMALNRHNMKKNLWPAVKKSLELPDGPTFYSLKHLGNSYALSKGLSSQAQASRLGHSTDRMVREVYREILTEEALEGAAVFDRELTPHNKNG